MFITEQQLRERLSSKNNIVNIISSRTNKVTPDNLNVPDQIHPPVSNNLPEENNRQRAARIARHNIVAAATHGEYTVNPNINNDIVRATVGILSASNSATNKELQNEFGMTRNQITGARKSKKLSLASKIERGKDRVSELAIDKLMHTLGLLTEEKISECEKPKDIADIAVSMSKIVASMSSSKADKKDAAASVQLTVYAPSMREVSSYTVVDV